MYLHAKFRRDIWIHGWDKTTSGFGKRTAAILEFNFRFRFRPMYSHWHTILHLPAKLRSSRMIVGGVMTSYPFFSRWRPAAILDLMWVMLDHPRSAFGGISSVLKFGLDPIYSFWRYCDFYILPFWLEIAYSRPFLGVLGAYFHQIWSPIVLTPKRPSLRRNTSFEP